MIRRLERRRRGEEGSALILALIFVTVIGLWISAVLSFADTSFRTTKAVTHQRARIYAADAAMDAVIHKVRQDGGCNDVYSAPVTNGLAVKVDCQPPLKPNTDNQFVNGSRAFDIGESPQPLTADARLTAGGPDAATMALTGFGPPTPTPALTSATLIVSHADANVQELTVTVTANPVDPASASASFSTAATPCQLCLGAALHQDTISVSGLIGVSLVNAQVTYTAKRIDGADGTESLDGIRLEVGYGVGAAAQRLTLKPNQHDQFDNATNAYQIAETTPAVATVSLGSTAATGASMVMSGYSRLTVPKDAVIEQAVLRAGHGEDADITQVDITIKAANRTDGSTTDAITLTADRTKACTRNGATNSGLCLHPGVEEDNVDLLAAGLDDPAQFKTLTITYKVTLAPGVNKSAAARLDGIWIDLAYGPEGFPHADGSTIPTQALLTLGTHSVEDGIHVAPGSAAAIRNGVASSSTITVGSGANLTVQKGDVVATGSCTGAITPACTGGTPGAASYQSALKTLPSSTPTQVPSCTNSPPVVTLSPGYYDDAVALSNLTSGTTCQAKVVLLQSGAYYFNFDFKASRGPSGSSCPDAGAPACTWTIDRDVRVVGGQPKRWNPGGTALPPFPGACDTNSGGVQLVFGGDSRLAVGGSARLELCPIASSADEPQRIAMYGLTPSHTTPPPDEATLAPTANDQFANPPNALSLDAKTANAKLTSTGAGIPSTSIELHGYSPISLPPSETISKVTLRIVHADLGDISALTATVTNGANQQLARITSQPAPCDSAASLCIHAGLVADTIDLTTALSAAPMSNLRVRFDATLAAGEAKNGSESLDGIAIEVSHGIPLGPQVATTLVPSGHNQFSGAPMSASSSTSMTASMFLTGFDQVALAGATIEKATLRVTHHETGGASTTLTAAGGNPVPLTPATAPTTFDLDLGTGDAALAKLTAFRLRYVATMTSAGGTATLDSVAIDVVYRVPQPALVTATGHDQFATTANAFAIDGVTADVVLASGRATTAALTLAGYGPALPSTAPVTRAVLRVRHRESGDVAGLKATVVIGTTGTEIPVTASTTCSPGMFCLHNDLAEDRIPIALTSPAQFSDLRVRYEVQLASGAAMNATEALDGILIEAEQGSAPNITTTVLKATRHDQFTEPGNALRVDGASATATLGSGAPPSASIRLAGYNQLSLPDGAVIDAVTLRVVHSEVGTGFPQVTVTGVNGTKEVRGNATIDLTPDFDRQPKKLNGLSVQYSVALAAGASSGTATLDGISIEVKYRRAPMLEGLTGCGVTPKGCAFFSVDGSAGLALHGTLYAPTAKVRISLRDVANFALARGLVGRTAELGILPKAGYNRPTIIVPDVDTGERTRLFTAYIVENGKLRELLRTMVRYIPPPAPDRPPKVSVLAWSVLP